MADFLRGTVERQEGRSFAPGSGLNDTLIRSSWRYRGIGYTVGGHYSPGPAGAIGASVSFGGELDAELRTGDGENRSYELPLTVQAGGSGRVLPNLLLALSGSWSGWSSLDDALVNTTAHDAWSAQAGVEWDGILLRQTPLPVRIGGRIGVLPFGGEAEGEGVDEKAATFGFGMLMAGGAVRPDVGFEFGRRSNGAGLDEEYWRVGISMRVLGR